jgi:uncharacterized protein
MSGKYGKGWNPYLAGALTGLLMVLSIGLAGRFFGASTTFARTAAMLESLVSPERVAAMPYFIKNVPVFDWQWLFVAGILVGAFVSAKLFQDFRLEAVPPMWAARFGPGRVGRGLVAFAGGVVAMFGARLADG